jgi:Ca2+-binding EF-hand superfamily protein
MELKELVAFMRERFPDIKVSEVHAIFEAADRDHNGSIGFCELRDYTRGTEPTNRRLRDKMLMALATPGLSSSYREGEERLQFRRADMNLDGHLDMKELETLMQRSFSDIKRRDVRDLFQAMDRNHDGKLDFHEVCGFTHSTDASRHRLREKVLTALALPQKVGMKTPGAKSRNESRSSKVTANACGASTPTSQQRDSNMRRASSASAVGSLIAGRTSP